MNDANDSKVADEFGEAIDPDIVPIDAADPQVRKRIEGELLVSIGLAGAVGALARYALSRLITTSDGAFPWSTFIVNISGSLAIGFVAFLFAERLPNRRFARPICITGFLGAYTTFSTYMVDTDSAFRDHHLFVGVTYLLTSAVAGVLATTIGLFIAHRFVRRTHDVVEVHSR